MSRLTTIIEDASGRHSSARSGSRIGSLTGRMNSITLNPKPVSARPSSGVSKAPTKPDGVSAEQMLDLAFLVDSTGSMQPYIDMVRRKLPSIARDIRASFPDSQLRVAFVGYRDYDDAQPLVVLDFRALSKRGGSVSNTFEAFLRELHATGGGDAAEDVFSGLEAVARLDWRSTNRVLVHIADAPCHGAEFHNGSRHPGFDDYPAGDRKGRDASKILRKLQRDAQISAWLFCHLTKSTYKMVARFKQILGPSADEWIEELQQADLETIPTRTVRTSTATIKATVTRSRSVLPTSRSALPSGSRSSRAVVSAKPAWNTVRSQPGVVYRSRPGDVNAMLTVIASGKLLPLTKERGTSIKIAPSPFSDQGACRWPYWASMDGRCCVVKRFRENSSEKSSQLHAKHRYQEQMEVQAVSGCLAKAFNEKCREGYSGIKEVKFSMVYMLAVDNGAGAEKVYNLEEELQGEWVKYSSNSGYVNKEEFSATAHAFQHYTYVRTDGLLLVTDIQGVKQVRSDGSERFLLCDPAIHCAKHPARFSNTNLGQEGINRFFATHKCNAICAQLGLPAAAGAARTTSGSRLVGTKLPGTRLIGTKILSAKLPGSGLLGSKLLSSAH